MARQAGGTARIEQHLPVGTSVVLWLPSVEPTVKEELATEHTKLTTRHEAKTVLVVDDDPDVRLFLSTSLETLGFDVKVAESAEHGLLALEEIQADLLLVDFAMPGMSGAQMAEVVRLRWPELPIIFASGYSETAAIELAVGPSAVLLRKPFGVSDLDAVVNSVLGAR